MRERFNTVAVAIPAQLFNVRCHVTIDRQVPVMTDFAVRLLHLSGPLEVGALREYFGLSASEFRDLLELLREEGLVGEANGRISLTSYAESRFTASSDGLPRFTKIAERQSRPVFELLSYTPLPKALSGSYWDNALELKWSADDPAAGNTIDRAEAAFHKHFLDIERFELEDENRRAYACYKVDEIRAGRPFSVPLPVHFEVDVEGNVEFEIDAQLELLPESLRSLVRTLTADRIATLSTRSDHLRAFIERFDDELLGRYMLAQSAVEEKTAFVKHDGRIGLRKDPAIDFGRYIHEVHGQANGEVYDSGKSQALLGALYMPKCQSRFLIGLRKALAVIKRSANEELPKAIFWVIPDSELWGRTSLVLDLVNGIRGALKDGLGLPLEVVAIAPCHQNENRDRLVKRARHLLDGGFNRVFLSPYQPKQECVEVLLIPGIYGAATYQWAVPSADRYNVPLGFLTQSGPKLQKMAGFARAALASSLHGSGWGSGSRTEERKFWFSDAVVSEFSFLDRYVDAT
ncbi:hypothetical protein [Burkholderia cenocepacia]|uniref:hypothetical protein n=1 Tax=Burkholderia cenocepacia TaxID=95486 RepID=UPI000F5BAC57|nr:hypothetical protein [Burkholderia cenocepacia]MCW3605955.1 hypothetical protein [Burkholderia cenocepacia]MCW5187549.1 hypothetical protein [Burkholderia cenocepacia]RQV60359.1 hypothetical protein DF018_29185 [Burkholderia cenocepacia]